MRMMRGYNAKLLSNQGMVGGEEVGAKMMAEVEGMIERDMEEMQEIMVLYMMMEEMIMIGEMPEQWQW